jgi:multisubunit Na+/H+ antiporter MnhF subunit
MTYAPPEPPSNGMSPLREEQVEAELAVHIVSLSAMLVGVCLTVIGLIHVAVRLKEGNTPADDILAGDAVLFLVTCLLAYASLRARRRSWRRALERLADACFLLALTLMTLVCAVVAFELL